MKESTKKNWAYIVSAVLYCLYCFYLTVILIVIGALSQMDTRSVHSTAISIIGGLPIVLGTVFYTVWFKIRNVKLRKLSHKIWGYLFLYPITLLLFFGCLYIITRIHN